MGSERLPGKTMQVLDGKPMLWHLISRLRQCKYLDEIIVATAVSQENDEIESFCLVEAVPCFRGPEDDVLGRMVESLKAHHADTGVVVYGDNPLVDPVIVDEHILLFRNKTGFDWIGNDLKTTFPPGMEVEVFSYSALLDAEKRATNPLIREHGTLFIRQHSTLYKLFNVEAEGARRRPEIHLGIDTPIDAEVLEAIIKHFSGEVYFSLEEIIRFVDRHPSLLEKNRNISRRWRKYRTS